MTGCRHGAKNTLPKNYLYLAEQLGAEVQPLTTVTALRPSGAAAATRVDTVRTGAWLPGAPGAPSPPTQVVVAAGAYGTQRLLHRMRDDAAAAAAVAPGSAR